MLQQREGLVQQSLLEAIAAPPANLASEPPSGNRYSWKAASIDVCSSTDDPSLKIPCFPYLASTMLHGLKHRREEVPPEKRRFLVWKNLGDVYAKLGSDFNESALRAYVTATEIDGQDAVLWHRLGSMAIRTEGRARLARYALEQGLTCSPYHWGCLNKLLEVLVSLDDWQAAQELAAYMLHLAPTHCRARQVLAMANEVFHPDPVALQAALDGLAARASAGAGDSAAATHGRAQQVQAMANDVFHPDPVALQAALDGLAARASAAGVSAAGDSAAATPAAGAAAAAGDENGLGVGRSAGATVVLEAQEQGAEQQGSALGNEVSVRHSPELELRGRSWAELILNTVHVFRTVQQRSVERLGLEYPQPVAGVSVSVVLADSPQGGDSRRGSEGFVREGNECGRGRSNEGPQEKQELQSGAAAEPVLSERNSSVGMATVPKSCPVEAAFEPTALPQQPFPAAHPSESPLPEAPLDPPTVLPQPDPSSRVSAVSEPNSIAVVDLSMDEDSQSPPDATTTPSPSAALPAAPGPPDVEDALPTLTPPFADSPLTQTPETQTPVTQIAATFADVTPVSTQEESSVVMPAALGPAPDASAAAATASVPAITSLDTVVSDAVASAVAAADAAAPAVPAKSRKRPRHPLSFVGTERRTRQQMKEMQLQEAKGKESTLLESAKPLPPKRLRVFDILSACFKQQSRFIGACDGIGLAVAGKNGGGKEGLAAGVAEGGVGADAAAAVGVDSVRVGSGGGACDGLEMLHMLRRKQVLVRFFSKEEEWSSVDVAAGAEAGASGGASEGVKAADSRDPAGDAKRLGEVEEVSAAEVEQVQSFLTALPKRLPLLQAASLILQYLASHLSLCTFTHSVLDALLWLERQAASWEGRAPNAWLYLGELYLLKGMQSDGESRGRQEAVGGAVERECVHCLAMAEQGQMDEEGVRWEVDGGAWGRVGEGRQLPEQADGEAEELGQEKGQSGLGGWEKVGFWVRLRASQGQVAMRRGEHGRAIELFTWCRDALGRAEQMRGRSDGTGTFPATAGPEAVAAVAHAAVEVPHLACVWGLRGSISVQSLDELLSELHVDCVLAGLSGKGGGETGQEFLQPPQQQQQLINMMKPLLLRDGAAGMGGGAGKQRGRSFCLPGLASHSSTSEGCQGENADSQHSEQSSGKWLETLKRVVAATRGMAQEQPLTLVCYKHILALLSSRVSMGALPPAPAKATPAVSAALEGSAAAAAGKASAGGGGQSDAGAICEAELMQAVQGLRDLTVSMALGTGLDSQVNEQHLEELQQVVAVLIDFAFYKHRLLQEQPASQLSREVYQPGLGAAAARSGILAAWQGMVVAWQGLLVDLCMALCCLQHMRVSVVPTDKVAMWAITHSILASQGLCCASASPSSSSTSVDIPPSTTPNAVSAPVSASSSCRQSGNGSTAAAEFERGEGTSAAARAPSGRGAFLALSAQLLTNVESLLTPSVHAGSRKAKAVAAGVKEPRVRGLKGGKGGEKREGGSEAGARWGSNARDRQRTGDDGPGSSGDKAEKAAVRVGDTPNAGRASMGNNGGAVSGSGQGARVEDAHGKRCALQEIEGAMDQCFLCLYGVQLRGAEEDCARALRHVARFAAAFTIERLVKLVPLLTSIHSFFPSPPPAILARHSVEPFLDDPRINDWGIVGRIVVQGKRLGEEGKLGVGGHALQEDGDAEEGRRNMEDGDGALGVKGKERMHDGGEQLNGANTLDASPDLLSYIPVLRPMSFLSEWASSHHSATQHANSSCAMNSDTYADVYNPLFAMLARIEPIPMGHHMPPGFFLEPKGHSHVLQVTSPLLADLCYHSSNTNSWLKLALFYDEASDLMLNDGAKMKGPADWHAEEGVLGRLQGYRQRCTRCLVEALATPGCRLPFEVAALEQGDSRWEGWTGREGRKVWEGRKGSEVWEGCEEQRKRVVSVLELLAFVVYDSIQNVVPSYDRLRHTQVKDHLWLNRCRLAFQLFRILQSLSPNWQYPFFQGKLAEKLHLPASLALPVMHRAVSLRPNAVDTAYRLHASRLKALARGRVEAALSDDDIRALVSNSDTKDALAKILQPNEEEAKLGRDVTAAEESIARENGHVTDGGEREKEGGEDEGVEGRGEAQGEKEVERGVAEGMGADKGAVGKKDGSDEDLEMGKGVAERLGDDMGAEGEKDGSDEVLEMERPKEGKEGATQEEETDEGKDGEKEEEKDGGTQKGGLRERQVENEEEGGGGDGDGDGGGGSVGEGEDEDDDVVLVEPTQVEPTQFESTQDSCSVKKRKGGDLPSATGKKHSRLAGEGESLGQAEQGAAAGGEASRAAAEPAVQSEEHGAGIADVKKEKQQAELGESEQLEQQGKKQPVVDIQQLRQHWPLVWQHLFQESEKGVRECLEGDFKHFHRGRYCLAKAYLRRGAPGDLERAKSELGFCFRKAKVAFAMNMWEICVHTKHAPRPKGGSKGARVRRKVVGLASVEVAESSRKFMTCVRVYLMMYLRLCCYTGDVAALEGALSTLKTDKEFSTALVDLVPLALALFVLSLHASVHPTSKQTTQHISAALGVALPTSAIPTSAPAPVSDVAASAISTPSAAAPPESPSAAVAGAAEAAASCAAPAAAISSSADASPTATAATVHVLGLAAPGASAAAAPGAADGTSASLRRAEGESGNEPAEASFGDRLLTLYLDNVSIWGEGAEVLRLSRVAYVETVTRGGEDRTNDKGGAAAQLLAWEEEQERSWFDVTEWHVLSALKQYVQRSDLDFFASAAAKIRTRAPSPPPPSPLPEHPVTPGSLANPVQTCGGQSTPSHDAPQPALPFSSLPPSALHHTPSAPPFLPPHNSPHVPFPSATSQPSTLGSLSPLKQGAAFAQRMHLHTMLCWSHALLGALSDILPVSAWPLFPWLHPLSLSDLPSATPPLLCKGAAVTEKEEENNGGAEEHTGLEEGDCLEGTEEDSVGGSDSEDSILDLISDDEDEEEEDEVDEEGKDEAKEVEEGGRRDAGKCMDEAGMGRKVCEGAGGKERVDQPSTPAAAGVESGAARPVPVLTRGGLRVTIPLLQGQTLMQPAPYPSSASDATAPPHNPMQSQSSLAIPSSASTKAFGTISATGAPAAGSAAASLPSTPSCAPSFPGKPICTTSSPSPFPAAPPSSPFPSLTPPRANPLLLRAKASESDADRALALLRSAKALEREASGELPFGKVLGGGKKGGVSGGGGALGVKRMKAAAREAAGSGARAEVLGKIVGGGGGGEAGQGMQVTGPSFVENRKAGEVPEQVGGGELPREGRSNEEEEVEGWRTRLHGLSTQLLEVAYALVHGRSLAALAAAEQAQAQMKVQAEEQARADELAVGGKRVQGETALNRQEDEGQLALVPDTETEAKNVRLEERRQHRLKESGNVMASVGGEDGDEEAEEDGKDAGGGDKGDEKQVDGKAAPSRQGSRPALSLQNDAGKVSEGKKQLAAAATPALEASPTLSRPVKPTTKPYVKPLARPPAKPPSMAVVKPGLKPVLKAKQSPKATSTPPAAPSIHESLSMSHSALQMHQGTPSTSHQGPNRGARQGASVQKKAVMAVAGAVGEDTGGKAGKMGGQEVGTSGTVRKPAGGGKQTAGVSGGEGGAKSMRAVLKRKRAVAVADESARRIAAPGASVDAAVGGADDDMPAPTPATTPTAVTEAPPRPPAMAGSGAVDAKASQAKKAATNRASQQQQGAPVASASAHTKSKAPPAVVKEVKVVIPGKTAIAVKKRNVAAEGTISGRTGTMGAASVAKVVGEVDTSYASASVQGSTGRGSAKLLARKMGAAKREPITSTPEETNARSGQGVQAAAAKVALSGPGKGAAGTVAMGGTGTGPVKKRKLGEGKGRGSVVKLLEQQMEGVAAQGEGKAPALKAGTATTSKAGVSQTTLADAANPSDPGVATAAASAVGVGGRGQKKGVNPGGKGSLKVVQIGAPRDLPKLKLGSSAPKDGTKSAAVTVGPVSVKAGSGRSNQVSQKGIFKKGAKGKTLASSGAAQMASGVPGGVTDEVGTCTDVTREATGEKCTQDPASQGEDSSATVPSPGAMKVPATQRKKQPLVIKIQKPRHAVAVEGSSLSKDHDLE
ncbi:unnamed protein product [Closterium sp. Yama58-4]|nr:unnamed protein product [Closterium sp. Yama58-4]